MALGRIAAGVVGTALSLSFGLVEAVAAQEALPAGPLPVISIYSPSNGAQFTGSEASIIFDVSSPSGAPVDRIEVLVNGEPVPISRGVERADEVSATAHKIVVPLPNRDVTISLVARVGDLRSAAATIGLVWGGPGVERFKPKLYGVLIGVSHYEHQQLALQYAAKDARDFASALQRQAGGLYSGVEFKVLTDGDATRGNILKALEWLKRSVTSNDLGVVYFAGHGWTDEVGNFWFLPVNGLPDDLDHLVAKDDILRPMDSLAGKALLFIDACHAASTRGGQLRASARGSADIDALVRDFGAAGHGIVTFASSQGNEVSLERSDWGNGAFTKALVEALGEGRAAGNGSGQITLSSLNYYVANRVKELTGGVQHPVMNQSNVPDFPIGLVNIDLHIQAGPTINLNSQPTEALAAFDRATRIGTKEAYQAIVDSYPGSVHAKLAAAAIAALPKSPEVASLPPAAPLSKPPAPVGAPPAPGTPAVNPPSPGGKARPIAVSDLSGDADPRLRAAVAALGKYEMAYGYFRDHLYIAVLSWGADWSRAKQLAEQAGGHLVTIADKAENEFVYNLFAPDDRFVEVGEGGMDINGPLIGLFQPKGSHEPRDGWRWVTDEPLKYTNWTRGQPNNWEGRADIGRFYSYGTRSPRDEQRPIRWDDAYGGDGAQSFILEVEPSPAAAQTDGSKSSALTFSYATAEAYSGPDPRHGNNFIGAWIDLHHPSVDDQEVRGLIGFEITATFPPGRPEALEYDIGISDSRTVHYFNLKYSMDKNDSGNHFYIDDNNVDTRWKAVFSSMSKEDQRIVAGVCNSIGQPEAENQILQVSEKAQEFWRVPKHRRGIIAVGRSCYRAIKELVGRPNEMFVEAN